MKLEAIIIEGFRAYRERHEIPISQITAFIGRNDVGKSTILEALDAFFNDVVDAQDVNTRIEDRRFSVGCVFSDLPNEINLDAATFTSLSAEYLLNRDGKLEIYKTWKATALKAEVERIFVKAHAPTADEVHDLLFKKRDDLRAIVEREGIDANRNRNPDMRGAIYQHFQNLGRLNVQDREVDLDRPKDKSDRFDDSRKVWKKLNDRHLPVYSLFKSEQVRGDKEAAVRSPLDATLKASIRNLEEALKPIADQIEAAVRDTTERTLERLRRDYPAVARNLVPEYKPPSWSKAFDLDVLRGDDEVPLNKRGAGVRRLVVLAFFQAEAEKRRQERSEGEVVPPVIYAVEEPETSQHPDFQRNIIRAFEALADSGDQVLLTTHVPGVAALLPTSAIRLVSKSVEGAGQVETNSNDVYERVVEALGLMPDRRAQVALFVEGPNDVEFIRHVTRLHRSANPDLVDFDKDHRVVFVPTGGGTLQHWIDQKYLANAKLVEVHIYDRDDLGAPKYQTQVDGVNARGSRDIAFLTTKREMENYIHPDAIATVLGVNVRVTDWTDVPDVVAEQVYIMGGGPAEWRTIDPEKKRKKVSQVKRSLNTGVASQMTLAQLQEMDTTDDIGNWLRAITQRLVV